IEGAYDTTAYVVTYEPTDGGEKVENHKWVVHEEIENEEGQPYEQGDEVVLEADHRSEEHTSELQSRFDLVCRLLLEKKNRKYMIPLRSSKSKTKKYYVISL